MKTTTFKSAKEIRESLPSECWGVLPEDQSLIRIIAGESGYFPTKGKETWIQQGLRVNEVKTTSELADKLNAKSGITKAQRKAMEWGSMFGWEHGLSNPDRYNEDGTIKK